MNIKLTLIGLIYFRWCLFCVQIKVFRTFFFLLNDLHILNETFKQQKTKIVYNIKN